MREGPGGSGRKRAAYLGPARRRPQLIEIAAAVFAGRGHSTSMDDLAAEAGVSKPVLYDCFQGGRDELQDELLNRAERIYANEVLRPLAKTTGTRQRFVRAVFDSVIGFAAHDPPAFQLLFGCSELQGPRARARLRYVRAESRRAACDLIEAGLGRRSRSLHADAIATLAIAIELARPLAEGEAHIPQDVIDQVSALIGRGRSNESRRFRAGGP